MSFIRERERELFGPKKRGPKPETFLLKAKAKEKTYEFRRETPRGIQVSYPIPEPVITPRAREGLRAVVPTIFPPSAVNRGESIQVRPPEPERRPRPDPPASLSPQESARIPKKRGRKPKLHHHEKDDRSSSAEPDAKRSRLLEEPVPHSLSKMSRRFHHHGETSERTLIQLTKRFQEETTITPKSSTEQRHVESVGLSYTCAFNPDVRRKTDQGAHRTNCLIKMTVPHSSKTKNSAEKQRHQFKECVSQEQPAVLSKQPQSSHPSGTETSSWTPCFTNLDTVTVTDITMNFLTVTIKESSTDKGFFRDKR